MNKTMKREGVVSGEISAVIPTSEYLSCNSCHSKVVSEDNALPSTQSDFCHDKVVLLLGDKVSHVCGDR